MRELKLGHNKGNSRIWIEIKEGELQFKFWLKGARYNREITEDSIILRRISDGKYKVSGKPNLSIIDLSGKWLTKWGNGCQRVTITDRTAGYIEIKRVK
tara:strand:- start:246 stop:542 length:297 start_codon:yes stop_codon:yes gene_type:complete